MWVSLQVRWRIDDDAGDDDEDGGDGDAVGLQVYRCVGLVSEPSSSPPWRPGFLNSGLIIMIMMSMMTMMMMRMAVMVGEYWLFCVIFLFKQAICEDDVNEDGDLLQQCTQRCLIFIHFC